MKDKCFLIYFKELAVQMQIKKVQLNTVWIEPRVPRTQLTE